MTVLSFTTGTRQADARAPGALPRLLKFKQIPFPSACAQQVHKARVRIVGRLTRAKTFPGADGLLTTVSDQPLAIFTADCVPVFLRGDTVGMVGLLHAGWRGVQGKILAEAARLVRRTWRLRASQIQAWAGPSIGPCCFEVGWDVARHFPLTRRRCRDRWGVDLVGELKGQASRLGIRWGSQKASNDCTMHHKRYFSYRRDKTPQRQVSVIMKRKSA